MRADSVHPSVGRVSLPETERSPWWELGRRLLLAAGDPRRHRPARLPRPRGLHDGNAHPGRDLTLLDSFYYTTVTLSTTGYGDIAPVSEQARLVNALVITPARIAFLVLLIGTTLEVLASQGREMFRVARWRKKKMDQHVVVVGYGTKGRSAIDTLVSNGYDRDSIVVVDPEPGGDGGGQPRPARRSSPATPRGAGCCARPASRRRPTSSSPPTATTPTCWSP